MASICPLQKKVKSLRFRFIKLVITGKQSGEKNQTAEDQEIEEEYGSDNKNDFTVVAAEFEESPNIMKQPIDNVLDLQGDQIGQP